MATSPIEYEGWSSNTGIHVMPALVVFQTPPEPTATYQVVASSGWTAMSAMRPPISAGPMPRSARPCAASWMTAGSAGGVWAVAGRVGALVARIRARTASGWWRVVGIVERYMRAALVAGVGCGGGEGRRVGWKWTAPGWQPQGVSARDARQTEPETRPGFGP